MKPNDIVSKVPVKPPYFLPLFSKAPVWKWYGALIAYDALPSCIEPNWRKDKNWENAIMVVESGGLTNNAPETQFKCQETQLRISPDMTFILDFPVKMKRAEKGRTIEQMREFEDMSDEKKLKRIKMTIDSAKIALETQKEMESLYEVSYEPMTVIQGFDERTLVWCTEEMYSMGYNVFALGTVTTASSQRARTKFSYINSIVTTRDIIGKGSWLHLLGVTDVNSLTKVKGYFTSFDSATISVEAKNAHLIKEDGHTLFIGNRGTEGAMNINTIKYGGLTPEDGVGFYNLMETNFRNYVKRLLYFDLIDKASVKWLENGKNQDNCN